MPGAERGELGPRTLFAATAAATVFAVVPMQIAPLLVGALIDGLGLAPRAAGLLMSLELLAAAATVLVVAPQVARVSRRALVVWGACLLVAAQLGSALAPGVASVAVARVLAGVGEGVVGAAVNAVVAGTRDPDRFYARLAATSVATGALLLAALPFAIEPFAHRGAYLLLAALVLALLPLAARVPAHGPAGGGAAVRGLPSQGRALAVGTLVAGILVMYADGATWSFSERLGKDLGIEATRLGAVFAASALAGLLGSLAAMALGLRAGRALPLAGSVAALAALTWAWGQAGSQGVFIAVLFCKSAVVFFFFPYFLGTAAALDRQGRWAAAASASMPLGSGVGPALAGTLAAAYGFAGIGWVSAGSALLALALFLGVLRALAAGGLEAASVGAGPGAQ
ncbi:MAG: MFS transporter [Myxococcota bacterium]